MPDTPTTPQGKAGNAPADFHLKEWEFLRESVRSQADSIGKLELAVVAGLGGFYAWFVSSASHPRRFLLIIPCLLVFMAGLRAWGALIYVKQIATYLRTLEAALSLGSDGLIGWDRTRDATYSKHSPFKVSAALFWPVALLVTIGAWFFL